MGKAKISELHDPAADFISEDGEASSDAGDLVVDPFVGSVTADIAATRLGRRFIGIDTEAEFLDRAIKRYRAELLRRCARS